MRRSDFSFELPPELIAQQPLEKRTASRLLGLDGGSGAIVDSVFADLPGLLEPGDLMVFNDTRVIPARIFGQKDSGGRIECLIERVVKQTGALAQIRASKSPKTGSRLQFADGCEARVQARKDGFESSSDNRFC